MSFGRQIPSVLKCPQCGERGAFMGSTIWGHGYQCCSDKCGMAFKTNPKRVQLDIESLREEQAMLRHSMRHLKAELKMLQQPALDINNPQHHAAIGMAYAVSALTSSTEARTETPRSSVSNGECPSPDGSGAEGEAMASPQPVKARQ